MFLTKYLTIGLWITCGILVGMLYFTYTALFSCNTKLAAAQQQIATLEDKLDQQNAKIGEWEKSAKASQEAARKAVEASREKGKRLAGEIARLKRAAAEPRVEGPCPAGQAVTIIRQGLK